METNGAPRPRSLLGPSSGPLMRVRLSTTTYSCGQHGRVSTILKRMRIFQSPGCEVGTTRTRCTVPQAFDTSIAWTQRHRTQPPMAISSIEHVFYAQINHEDPPCRTTCLGWEKVRCDFSSSRCIHMVGSSGRNASNLHRSTAQLRDCMPSTQEQVCMRSLHCSRVHVP